MRGGALFSEEAEIDQDVGYALIASIFNSGPLSIDSRQMRRYPTFATVFVVGYRLHRIFFKGIDSLPVLDAGPWAWYVVSIPSPPYSGRVSSLLKSFESCRE